MAGDAGNHKASARLWRIAEELVVEAARKDLALPSSLPIRLPPPLPHSHEGDFEQEEEQEEEEDTLGSRTTHLSRRLAAPQSDGGTPQTNPGDLSSFTQ